MKKLLLTALLATGISATASAHEIWIEHQEGEPARIYLGEPAHIMPEGGDPEFHRFTAPKVFLADPAATLQTERKDGYFIVKSPVSGDIRAMDDTIFGTWESDGKTTGAAFYARAGRTETEAHLPLEIIPTDAGADTFVVQFTGKPVADAEVTVIAPGRWQKIFTADGDGKLDVPGIGDGRYILATVHTVEGKAEVGGKPVEAVMHISTTTFWRQ